MSVMRKQPFESTRRSEKGLDVANISKSNNESGRLDDTITPSMCGNAARIRSRNAYYRRSIVTEIGSLSRLKARDESVRITRVTIPCIKGSGE